MLLEEVGRYFFPMGCLDPGLSKPCPPAKPSCQEPQPGRVPAGTVGTVLRHTVPTVPAFEGFTFSEAEQSLMTSEGWCHTCRKPFLEGYLGKK